MKTETPTERLDPSELERRLDHKFQQMLAAPDKAARRRLAEEYEELNQQHRGFPTPTTV